MLFLRFRAKAAPLLEAEGGGGFESTQLLPVSEMLNRVDIDFWVLKR